MDETAQMLWNDGTCITTIEHHGLEVSLYLIDDEFYEVYYNALENKIVKVVQAYKVDLEKYLNQIELEKFNGR